jgi:hypothetical protein
MEPSRRHVLGSAAAIAAGLAIGAFPDSPALAATVAVPRRSMFTPLVGTTLKATRSGTTWKVTLSAVHDLVPFESGAEDRQFRLVLTGGSTRMSEGIYRLTSAKLAPVDLLLTRTLVSSTSVTLHAVVNRLA